MAEAGFVTVRLSDIDEVRELIKAAKDVVQVVGPLLRDSVTQRHCRCDHCGPAEAALEALAAALGVNDEAEPAYIRCSVCGYERPAGQGCSFPCV